MCIHPMKWPLAGVAVLAFCLPASAALAPHYQRAEEMRAILADAAVVDAFERGSLIEKIEYIGTDLYRVTAGPCQLDVAVADKLPGSGLLGPRQLEIRPGAVSCR